MKNRCFCACDTIMVDRFLLSGGFRTITKELTGPVAESYHLLAFSVVKQ
jgi:hypothetical protein